MKKTLTRLQSSRSLLQKILEAPQLVESIRALPPQVLAKVIRHIGLGDCGELVSMATGEQLARVFDEDLWNLKRVGEGEVFNAQRFEVWLQILSELGPDAASKKISEFDEDFLVYGLSRLILVFDLDEMILSMVQLQEREVQKHEIIEKALESALSLEIDHYLIVSKSAESWDCILSLLTELDAHHRDFFLRVMDLLVSVSVQGAEENGGLYEVLTRGEMLESDVGFEREKRRSEEGYVAPTSAKSFLHIIEINTLGQLIATKQYDVETKAYFRDYSPVSKDKPQFRGTDSKQLLKLLGEAGALESKSTLLRIDAGESKENEKKRMLRKAIGQIAEVDAKRYDRIIAELNYLANVLMVGLEVEGESYRPAMAAEEVVELCAEGAKYMLNLANQDKSDVSVMGHLLQSNDLVKLFGVGYKLKHLKDEK